MGLLRPKHQSVDPRFLLYYYLGPDFQEVIRERTIHGSTVERLALAEFAAFPVRLPPLPEQRAISMVLGALDDKIELNRRMNATLEGMARALFQSWFVDFDPVRAKVDGRQPAGMDETTAALFPSAFQDSAVGHVPDGWTVEPIGSVVDCVGGGTPSTADARYWEKGHHHWATPKDLASLDAPILLTTARTLTDEGLRRVSSGLLPIGTVLLSSRAPVGYLAIAKVPVAVNQGFIALKPHDRASSVFLLNWCKANMADIEARATGTTFQEISKQNFRPILAVLPPRSVMNAFTALTEPLYDRIATNVRESRVLAALRDTLLPKLLSGEVRVPEALRTAEATL